MHIYRLELQDLRQSNYENTTSPTSVKLSELNESKGDAAYDVIDTNSGTRDVKMTPNPAYGTSSSIKMDENPAYV